MLHCVVSVCSYINTFCYLVVFAQISPHTGAVPSAHQDVVSEEINPGDGASELPGGRVIVVSQVGHHVVEFEHLVALVLLFQPCVKGNLGHGAVGGRAYCAGSCARSRGSW